MRTRITHISSRALLPLLLFFTLVINASGLSAAPAGSTFPVQVNPMLIPPYSLYLSDYFSGITERLSLTLTNRDLQQPQVRVKLRLTIACASGLTLTTHPQAVFDPIVLDAGVPTRLTMQELAPYFLPARLLTQGYMQGGKLSEGNVEFGFEVLEYNTGKVLSQKNIAFGNIISPKPPKLNLPINNDIVTVNEPQQLTFQWSPQYFSTGNVEYEFVIKELMDKTASPQEAFLYSREVYRTTTTASTINYTMGEPTLEGNKRYAWCVRAVMHEGVETANRFENDGYSPVSVFDMRYDCRLPMDVQATTERGTIMLRWLPQPHHINYVVSYRRTDFDANIWYTKTTTSTTINLSDIAPGQNYTYRVGAYCDDNTPVYSAPGNISVPAEDTEFLANCGKDPQIKITNRKPKSRLNVNDVIMAGDFPVTLTRVSGSNGTFTGEGYVRIPYLFANFAVRFSGIGVSEENRLISGVIETKYDKTESGVSNLDALDQGGTDGNIKSGITKANKTVEFALPEKFTVQYSEELATLTFKDETGTAIGNVDIPKNPAGKPILPLTVEDKNGNVYEVHENPEKSTSSTQPYVAVKLGKQEGEESEEELGDAGESSGLECGCSSDDWYKANGDCDEIKIKIEALKTAYAKKQKITLYKCDLSGHMSIPDICFENLDYKIDFPKGTSINIDPSKYTIIKTRNSFYGYEQWTLDFDGVLQLKIPTSEVDAEKKIRALEKWLFSGKADNSSTTKEIYLDNVQWFSQFNPIFEEPCGCWPTKDCNGHKISGNQCCNRAANKTVLEAGGTPDARIIIAQTNRSCENGKGPKIEYDDSGLTFNENEFNEAVQIIDISLKEHKLPVMIGVQHPYWNENKMYWYYKCGSKTNNPRATNHFIVIVGKGYDKTKKMDFYYFYEVAISDKPSGTSKQNKLWVDTNRHIIKGNVSNRSKEDYYIVTDVRKNAGKTYNLKNK